MPIPSEVASVEPASPAPPLAADWECLELHGCPGCHSADRTIVCEWNKAILLERAAGIEKHLAEVAPRMPQVIAAFQEKLAARLKEALANAEDDRIRQEVVLFANKIDVDEELTRLTTHIAELRRILAQGGAVGKRLDFLMQELNREANTLGSKAADVSVTQVSMELKLLIEQMREQIQNIE